MESIARLHRALNEVLRIAAIWSKKVWNCPR
jgi:hypothetical protein